MALGIAGSYNILMLSFLRICQTVFQSSDTILQSYHQWVRFLIPPHPHQHYHICLIIAILVDVKGHLTVVLTCIFLMTNELMFLCRLTIRVSVFWKNVYSNTLPIFKLGYLSLLLSCEGSLCILDSRPLLDTILFCIFLMI